MINPCDAYFAGLIDGEGCLTLDKRGPSRPNSFEPSVMVKMAHKEIVEALQVRFGGAIRMRPAEKEGWKDQWQWRVKHALARECLRALRPYLIVKSPDADKLLAYWANPPKRGPRPK